MLTATQMRTFADDGYAVIRGIADETVRSLALARIDELLEARPPAVGHTGHHFYFEPAENEPVLTRLLTGTGVFAGAQALVAPLELLVPPQVQVALTFPPHDHMPGRGHIDGLTPPEPDGRPGTFTMLAGVILSDQTRDFMGNLVVWPGSHQQLAAHLRENGPEAILTEGGLQPVDHSNPVQIHGAPGDVVLAHYLLSHNIGGNMSNVVRKTVYFRLRVAGHNDQWKQFVTDPFHEFPRLRSLAA